MVMAISMLSLVATVTVLAVHHRNDSTPVPQWLKVLVQLKPKTANKVENDHRGVGDEFKNVTPTGNLELDFEIRSDSMNTFNYDKLQTAILYGILNEMKENGKTATSATENEEWKCFARRLDVIFFRLFLVVTVLSNIVMVALFIRNA